MGIISELFKKKNDTLEDENIPMPTTINDMTVQKSMKENNTKQNILTLKHSKKIEKKYQSPPINLLIADNKNTSIYNYLEHLTNLENSFKMLIILGEDENKKIIIDDLEKLKSILIAGTTGTGKSMLLHSIILSLLYTTTPNQLKLILIDCKVIEFQRYNGIPHLLIPVITDSSKVPAVLEWLMQEILNRNSLFIHNGVKNIDTYNNLSGTEKLPNIVVIIDDIFDIMRINSKDIEELFIRILSMSRMAGIYLIISSQTALKTVISDLVKTNILNRISFKVSSSKESIAILDKKGAEDLLDIGSMLYKKNGTTIIQKLKGIYIDMHDVEKTVIFLKDFSVQTYNRDILDYIEKTNSSNNDLLGQLEDDADPLLMDAIEIVIETGQASTSFIQRRFKLGYAQAGRIIDQMEQRGIISGYNGSVPREVLISKERWQELKN